MAGISKLLNLLKLKVEVLLKLINFNLRNYVCAAKRAGMNLVIK
ncbi:hypothetical protein COLO4_34346 [Corchorus olitorius]|uniref:Uncharacterized protein n=1 Tax=Corchorus olitorius TaxID=93759 RepID=A0A1R3GLF2_9ROSI|nr:hypothetical protein COLO4_34346 [Corchorus olitorius]